MNQFGLQYVYTRKCHSETPYIAILNKQKCLFFFLSNREQEGKTCPVKGVGTSGRRWKNIRKGCRRVNMVEILHIHVCKWKTESC
jgi:hypothetical protein